MKLLIVVSPFISDGEKEEEEDTEGQTTPD